MAMEQNGRRCEGERSPFITWTLWCIVSGKEVAMNEKRKVGHTFRIGRIRHSKKEGAMGERQCEWHTKEGRKAMPSRTVTHLAIQAERQCPAPSLTLPSKPLTRSQSTKDTDGGKELE